MYKLPTIRRPAIWALDAKRRLSPSLVTSLGRVFIRSSVRVAPAPADGVHANLDSHKLEFDIYPPKVFARPNCAFPGSGLGSRSSVDEPMIHIVNRQGGEDARTVRSRVDADPVRPFLDFLRDRMSVDDNETMVAIVPEEWCSYPPQVGLPLFLERDPGPDPGMDDKIVAKAPAIDETLKELDVRRWHSGADEFNKFVGRLAQYSSYIDALALEALETAKLQPAFDERRVAIENPEQDLFMISKNEDGLDASSPVVP